MNLTNTQRISKLFGNLAANPDLVIPYLKSSVFSRRLPIDMGMPWWGFRAIARADQLIAGRRVFEFGTGGSTLRFAKQATSITSVEDDPKWAAVVKNRLAARNITNVDILLRPFDFREPSGFETSGYLGAVDSGNWDAVIIDGQDWSFRERITCFKRTEPLMERGSVIIIDDFWRYTSLLDCHRARQVEVFESVGPARLGVTSTAFFYY